MQPLLAQIDSSWRKVPDLTLMGFVDAFYVYDFDRPTGAFRQAFLYNHNRHNEFNVNLGLLHLALNHSKYRARLGLQAGTYANDNYAAEPDLLKTIFEANVGMALNKKNSLWLDAGVLPSHIGFESALSVDNLTLTRSLSAENSPYFLTGTQLSFRASEQLYLAALVVNGWQRIQRLAGNSLPSFGTQIAYTPSDKTLINWSTFIGTDDPDSTRRMRYFSNFYLQSKRFSKLTVIVGIDAGVQQVSKGSDKYHLWGSPTIIAQYAFNTRWKVALRLESYYDPDGVVVQLNMPNHIITSGTSINIDYSPTPFLQARLESRWLFGEVDKAVFNNFTVALSLAAKFSTPIANEVDKI
jgi:hypothetical protein